MTVRPFRVLGIQQVAIGGTSKERLRTLWVDKLGLEVTGNFVSERENVDEDISQGKGDVKVRSTDAAAGSDKSRGSHHAAEHTAVDRRLKAVEWLRPTCALRAGRHPQGPEGTTLLRDTKSTTNPVAGEGRDDRAGAGATEIVAALG